MRHLQQKKTYAHTSRNKKKKQPNLKKSLRKYGTPRINWSTEKIFECDFFSLSNLWFLTKRYIRRVKKNCVRTQENKSFSLEYWWNITCSKYIFHVNIFRSSLRNAWIRIEKKLNSINSERTQNVVKEKNIKKLKQKRQNVILEKKFDSFLFRRRQKIH